MWLVPEWMPRSGRPSRVPQQALLLALPVALLFRLALVVALLSACEAQFHLHPSILPVHCRGNERVPLALDSANEAVDLAPVQQQLAGTPGIGDHVGGGRVQRCDLRAEQEQFAVPDQGVAVGEIQTSGAQALYLPAFQGNAGLDALLDEVFVPGALVEADGGGLLAGLAAAGVLLAAHQDVGPG